MSIQNTARTLEVVNDELITTDGLDFNLVLQGEVQLPDLESLSIQPEDGYSADMIYALVELQWPQLKALTLAHGAHFGDTFVSDMKPLIQGTNFPKLQSLRLIDIPHGDELCSALAKSKLLPRLEVLELSETELSDDGAQALLDRPKALKRLQSLYLQNNYIDGSLHEALLSLCPQVVLLPSADE